MSVHVLAAGSAIRPLADGVPSSRRRALSRFEHKDLSPESFILDLLSRIEASETPATVMFCSHDGTPFAELLTSPGRICLAALHEGQVPLGVRLAERSPERAIAIKQALVEAKASGRRLGEVLLELGAVSSAHIREAILDQIVEGVIEIARAARRGIIESAIAIEPQRPSSPSSAFEPMDVYFRAMRALASSNDDVAVRFYRDHEGSGDWGALLVRRDVPLLIEARGALVSTVQELGRASRVIEQIVRSPALIAAGVEPLITLIETSTDSFLCLATLDHIALVGGLSSEERARTLAQAITLTS